MTRKSNTVRRVEDEARQWFVDLLDGPIPPERLSAWQAWMDANPVHRRAFDRAAEAWTLGGIKPDFAADNVRPLHPGPMRTKSPSRSGYVMPIAASLAVGVALSVLALAHNSTRSSIQTFDIETARAEQRQLALPDGSVIQAGPMTILHVSFSRADRRIKLDRGEALFHVAHDQSRPFRVSTVAGDIVAVGTAFDVHVERQSVSLYVTEGVVGVGPSDAKIPSPLSPSGSTSVRVGVGQSIALAGPSTNPLITTVSNSSGVTWPQGRLEYRDQTLAKVIDDVNRYARKPVIIEDSSLAGLTYTGTVQLDQVDQWVQALPSAFPISLQTRADGARILKKTPG